jgi:hypothetical protein
VFDSAALLSQPGVFTVEADPEAARAARERLQSSVAVKAKARQHARFASADQQLASMLPARFKGGEVWHVLSNGDIDALSYVKHIMAGERFEAVLLSCWAISRPAIEFLQAEFTAARVKRIDAYVGDIMPRDRPELHHMLCSLVQAAAGRVVPFKNHSKLWIFLGSRRRAVVMQTSANPNYNKRVEQTVITANAALAGVYKAWFDALAIPAPTFPNWTPHGWPAA